MLYVENCNCSGPWEWSPLPIWWDQTSTSHAKVLYPLPWPSFTNAHSFNSTRILQPRIWTFNIGKSESISNVHSIPSSPRGFCVHFSSAVQPSIFSIRITLLPIKSVWFWWTKKKQRRSCQNSSNFAIPTLSIAVYGTWAMAIIQSYCEIHWNAHPSITNTREPCTWWPTHQWPWLLTFDVLGAWQLQIMLWYSAFCKLTFCSILTS